ncbi:hypothetical protein LTR56_005832 [Elasticomyces elasticus]|nr:hypothetical protein LTR56_005832 [Elasticomyces elasticus]KAK3665266.1 hypothetical protein LTR22_003788 [Elasticomyces elasticus]KAK4933465.1 hypothetical protein LTR49_000459 [Elasticomyces elasticus]KAK5756396.1 hypothetical protein LTS12_013468 [Elasticomyces elasticus]
MAYPQTIFLNTTVTPASLLGRRREAVAVATLLYQLQVLKETGRYEAFKLTWHPSYSDPPDVPPVPNHLFWDSDIAKWVEGACYFLASGNELPEVREAVQELVEMIGSAQQSDGYINIHYTVVEPGRRWTNLRDMHELYNAGHLIEAALAHRSLFKNDLLLGPLRKYADLLCAVFGPGMAQIHGYPGHPEIELALLRLFEHTKEERYRSLAKYFLTERGNPIGCQGRHFYDVEAERRGADPQRRPLPWPEDRCLWYQQAHLPISLQPTIEGHSVRAMYLLTAVADLVRMEQPQPTTSTVALKVAMHRLWDNMIERKMYVTGGIGAIKQWEGFGVDYFLPQGTDDGGCYAETCAAIGVMMLAERILQLDLNGRFADIMELCLYNAVLTSMSHDGKSFTYVNQLASSADDLSKREEWFTCACCPPNVLRLFGQLGGYIWQLREGQAGTTEQELAVNLYISSTLTLVAGGKEVRVTQESDWPWKSDIKFSVQGSADSLGLKLRIPGWALSYTLKPECPDAHLEHGYLHLSASWISQNPEFTLAIPLKPRWITQPVHATTHGLLALARGPIVYCVEDIDNTWVEDHFKGTFVDTRAPVIEQHITADETTGDSYVRLELQKGAIDVKDVAQDKARNSPFVDASEFLDSERIQKPLESLNFIPYYFRANRGGTGQMRVGLRAWQH